MKRVTFQAPFGTRGPVCQLCEFSISLASRRVPHRVQALPFSKTRGYSSPSWSTRILPAALRQRNGVQFRFASNNSINKAGGSPEQKLEEVLERSRSMIAAQTVPEDQSVIDLLQSCRYIVDFALSDKHTFNGSGSQNPDDNATSSLLDLDRSNTSTAAFSSPQTTTKESFQQKVIASLSSTLSELIRDPKIFISPRVLVQYTEIQCQLNKVEYLPEAFSLYANKPAPRPSGSIIKYTPSNPKSPKNAIPQELADRALDVAVEQRNLSLALAIVDQSFCTPAFRRAKVLRKAGLPALGALATPPAAYMTASYVSTVQNTMDVSTATWIVFPAILAYVAFTSSIGLVAIATANDQMQRVSWFPGTPLRHRWVREEERAALDKIAVAWGFKDPEMQGEEEGEDWESLKEISGIRGMILDRTELMEGMQ